MNAPTRIDRRSSTPIRSRRRPQPGGLGRNLALGALAGVGAVFVLDRVDWALFLSEKPETRDKTRAVRPGGEPPAHVAATRLEQAAGAKLTESQHQVAGDVIHYAIGVAPAALYAAYRGQAAILGAGRGGLFGLALYFLQDQAFNTLTGLGADPHRYPAADHARGLAAHLAYGFALDLFVRALAPLPRRRRRA